MTKIQNKNTDTNQILNFFLLILRFGRPPLMLSSVSKGVQGGDGNLTSAILDLLEGFTVLDCFTVLDGFTVFLRSFLRIVRSGVNWERPFPRTCAAALVLAVQLIGLFVEVFGSVGESVEMVLL